MKILLLLACISVFSGCSINRTHNEFVKIEAPYSRSIVTDIVTAISLKYPKKETFHIQKKGVISQKVEESLRANGFAVSEIEGVKMLITIDDLHGESIIVSVFLDEERISRAYEKSQDKYDPVSPWTQYLD